MTFIYSDATSKKERRMTTNKVKKSIHPFSGMTYLPKDQRKATNFYASANVKNKSRKRAGGLSGKKA